MRSLSMSMKLVEFPLERPSRQDQRISRRSLLTGGGAALALLASQRVPTLQAMERAAMAYSDLKITEIEVHDIRVPYHDWAAYEMNHFYGPTRRTIYVAHTNIGLTGLAESEDRASDESLKAFVGINPFHRIANDANGFMDTALYDIMGKVLGMPVYKLIGPKYRSWVPMKAWTVSCSPQRMANTVKKLASLGYTWMKYHLSPFENVIDQVEAMQAVAPKGFRLHFDLTMGGSDDHPFDLLEKIARYPIAGCFEDPLSGDIEGYAELRKRCRLPILAHHNPVRSGTSVQMRAFDGYIIGGTVGSASRLAGLFALTDTPFSLQKPGGTILRAMALHMAASFQTCYNHGNTDTETWSTDVVKERLEPVNGVIRVPETPGLGLTLDRAELERLKKLTLPEQPKWIIKTRYANGAMMYNLADPKESIFMVRPDVRRLITPSYNAPVTTEWWDPDGTPEFARMMQRLEKEGMVLERP
ncbi:MAG: hypothetical protein FJW26_20015 [Acidimicrobiia bacterium]|nr:hypothetical protein [Acidimicrobiia bacterium]